MINIQWVSFNPDSPAQGYWDQALLNDILSDKIFKNMQDSDGGIVVIPAAYQGKYINEINKELNKLKWCVLFLTSDEESRFPVEKINHPNIVIYVQYPKVGRHDKYKKFPLGYTTETRKNLEFVDKSYDFFLSGQNTHSRRQECFREALNAFHLGDGVQHHIMKTEGFSKGMTPKEYMANMNKAKVAAAPSGAISQDSFRLYEALEAGAVPIADDINPKGESGFFDFLFGVDSYTFPIITDYKNLKGYIQDQVKAFPAMNNRAQAWWIKKKKDIKHQIVADIYSLSGNDSLAFVTVIIPVSPIKSHPDPRILAETIKSIRYHLPDSEIIITFDGVRKEQESKRNDYETFIRKALYLCNTEWNATPIIFNEHTHQVGMAREALKHVHTPLVLYMEQDTPLVTDEPIDWDKLIEDILTLKANVIRFHFEARIPKEHKHLMIGEPEDNLQKTIQWSQRPHLASTDFYRYLLRRYFSVNANCFIEDKMHSVVQQDYAEMQERSLEMWRLFIYHPDDKNIKRSLNNDGREGEEKYDSKQRF